MYNDAPLIIISCCVQITGEYETSNIAMKVFQQRHENAWNREVEIYNTYMLNHDNILKFLGSDRMEYCKFSR